MKLVLENGQEILLSKEVEEKIKQELKENVLFRNFSKSEDQVHWFINSHGRPQKSFSKIKSNELNAFTNKEFANKLAFKFKVETLLLAFKEQYDPIELDWEDINQTKFFIRHYNNKLCVDINWQAKSQGAVYFSSDKIAQQCIDTYKEILIKYFNLDI